MNAGSQGVFTVAKELVNDSVENGSKQRKLWQQVPHERRSSVDDFDLFGYEGAREKLKKRVKVRTLRSWVAKAKEIAKERGEIFRLIRGRHFNDRLLVRLLELIGCPEIMAGANKDTPNRN